MIGRIIMIEFNLALVKGNFVSFTATTNEWVELLKFVNDPNKKVHIRDLTIMSTHSASTGDDFRISLIINGEHVLDNLRLVDTKTPLSFGGDLAFTGKLDKPPIQLYGKFPSGTAPIYVTVTLTGVEEFI